MGALNCPRMALGAQPGPVNVIRDEDDGLRLSVDDLARVLCQPAIEDKPLVVVGIAGPSRSGKSFLMSFLMRFLRNRGWENPEWMGDEETCSKDGFQFKGGRRPHTRGIIIWNEVFTVPGRNGEELALLLVDTQGLYDRSMGTEENVKIFALTQLLCSHLMLNIKDKIDERELQSLQLFTEYAKATSMESDQRHAFQDLMFLVRDWPYPDDEAYGSDGGALYLADVLQNTRRAELNSLRENLRRTFEKIGCFLMPPPGENAKDPEFIGKNKDIEPVFLNCVAQLARQLFDPSCLKQRSHGGKLLTGRTLWSLLQACDRTFENGEVPKAENMVVAFATMKNRRAWEEGVKIFEESYQNEETATSNRDEAYARSQETAIQHFERETKFGGETLRQKYRQRLISDCQDQFKRISQWGDLRKIRARNLSSEKIHEVWSEYKACMKRDMGDNYKSEDELTATHKMNEEAAIRKYQTDSAKDVAFHAEHMEVLASDLKSSFEKFKIINEERLNLLNLGGQQELDLEYDGYLLLHQLAQQYREEVEKFASMYIPEEKLKGQMEKTQQSYFDLFEHNWDPQGARIHEYREMLIGILREEFEDCMKLNKRNKNLYQSSLKESATKMRANYEEMMHAIVKNSYCEPEVLQKAHESVSERVLNDFRVEVADTLDEERAKLLEKAEEDLAELLKNLNTKNDRNKGDKPSVDWDDVKKKLTTATQYVAACTVTIRKFKSILKEVKSLAKPVIGTELVLPATAAPYAIAAVAVVGISITAYCVYRHYKTKEQKLLEK